MIDRRSHTGHGPESATLTPRAADRLTANDAASIAAKGRFRFNEATALSEAEALSAA